MRGNNMGDLFDNLITDAAIAGSDPLDADMPTGRVFRAAGKRRYARMLQREHLAEAVNPPPPSIHDLKGSGSLECDADLVLLMHAPKHEDGTNFRHPTDRHAVEVWLRIGKGRGTGETRWPLEGGQETGGVRLRWHPGYTRFQGWEE